MQKKVKNRLQNLIIFSLIIAGFTLILLKNFKDSVSYYKTPSEYYKNNLTSDFRLGGVVKKNSIEIKDNGEVNFIVTDFTNEIKVSYYGLLPDLFRDGQGVVLEGKIEGDLFKAKRIFAKHDENYKPPILN